MGGVYHLFAAATRSCIDLTQIWRSGRTEACRAGGDPVATGGTSSEGDTFARNRICHLDQLVRLVAGVGFVQEHTKWTLRRSA
jgi:hypothetical protein